MNAIEKAIEALNPLGVMLRGKALAEGYVDEQCPKCEQVALAHHHLLRCRDQECPLATRKADGTPKRGFDYMRDALEKSEAKS